MNTDEAEAVAAVLRAVTGNVTISDHERIRRALHLLNVRASADLGVTQIVDVEQLDEAADDLVPTLGRMDTVRLHEAAHDLVPTLGLDGGESA